MKLEKELSVAIAAARQAGEIALSYAGRTVKSELKNGLRDSPVTEADRALDHYLHKTFTEAFPEDAWLSEEIKDDGSRFTKPRCWVVDPIDGTVGYVKWLESSMQQNTTQQNRRQFSISIALVENGKPILGVIYAPLRNQMASAVKGQGLLFNGQRVQPQHTVSDLAEVTYLSSVSEERDGLLDFLQGKTTLQAYGSVAYKLALTALSADTVTASVKPKNAWDLAAGQLLCEEVGLTVTDLAGNPLRYNTESVIYEGLIVAPPNIYPILKELLPNAPTGGYR
ncbi:MAG: 3'(2'),5'-bisphosphate nucleotidase CysQ [Alphaproteobacteria bacterium]|nr:3'(2'),5'-bisphosphate nucleotidase CysQ [Alphaproteobacteria bacterium]MDD9920302.1 3'(2'),5'-bisphosphate nucleotidase CysQ [Alphaproteobacteria bacterium]